MKATTPRSSSVPSVRKVAQSCQGRGANGARADLVRGVGARPHQLCTRPEMGMQVWHVLQRAVRHHHVELGFEGRLIGLPRRHQRQWLRLARHVSDSVGWGERPANRSQGLAIERLGVSVQLLVQRAAEVRASVTDGQPTGEGRSPLANAVSSSTRRRSRSGRAKRPAARSGA